MNCTSKGVFGHLVDDAGRCVHYHSELDVVANRCALCRKFYACFKCHDECEDHAFSPVDDSEEATVLCGVCGATFSYAEYCELSRCPSCGSHFNPRCALHKNHYAKKGEIER